MFFLSVNHYTWNTVSSAMKKVSKLLAGLPSGKFHLKKHNCQI